MEVTTEEIYPDYNPAHIMLPENDPLRIYGYEVFTHPNLNDYNKIKEEFQNHLLKEICSFAESIGIQISNVEKETFTLENYHHFMEKFNIPHHEFISFVSRFLEDHWCEKPYLKSLLTKVKSKFGRNVSIFKRQVQFRVVRPGSLDNNPPHRDHWYPYFKPLINVYVPLAGSHPDSSLPVVPFTHNASDNDIVPTFGYNSGNKTVKSNGVSYSVPEIKESKIDLNFHRPDVPDSSFMLFSPLIVHGGGDNNSLDTRFSFEIRLEFENWK